MLETTMYKHIKLLLPSIFWQRIENKLGVGIPDLHYDFGHVSGWMELKQIKYWPRNADVPIHIPWRPGQLAWYQELRQKSRAPYVLCFTAGSMWFFVPNYIKEVYTQEELQLYYAGENKDLALKRTAIKKCLAMEA